jgi:hypothetical protein
MNKERKKKKKEGLIRGKIFKFIFASKNAMIFSKAISLSVKSARE